MFRYSVPIRTNGLRSGTGVEYDTSKAVDRALTLLETLSCSSSPVGTRELARALDYPPTATHRLLATLELHGFVRKDPESEKYSLGTRILDLSSRLLESLDFRRVAIPIMREVRDRCNETVMLFVAEGSDRVCVESIESTHNLRSVGRIGSRRPIHVGSPGKVLLAYYSEDQLEAVLSRGLERITESTLADPDLLRQELARIRSRGWARSVGEGSLGNASVAAPIWGGMPPEVVASMSIQIPGVRFTPDREQPLIDLVREAAARISTMLGAPNQPARS